MTHPNPENESTVDETTEENEQETQDKRLSYEELEAELAKTRREAAQRRVELKKLKSTPETGTSKPSGDADLLSRLASLEEKLTAAETKALKGDIADEFGVPASALRGKTEEELREHAEELKALGVRKSPAGRALSRIPGSGSKPVGSNVNDDSKMDSFLRNMPTR